jgi:hypothetical protein
VPASPLDLRLLLSCEVSWTVFFSGVDFQTQIKKACPWNNSTSAATLVSNFFGFSVRGKATFE